MHQIGYSLIASVAALALTSCGGGDRELSSRSHPARFVYVVNSGSNTISGYAINRDTGALSAVSGSPFPAGSFPRSLTLHPDGHHLYVSNVGDNTISAYTSDANSGAL